MALCWLALTASGAQPEGEPASWLGDAGHFFLGSPEMRVNNPDGRGFLAPTWEQWFDPTSGKRKEE